ncbi:hypothetical protein JCM10908_000532 [Rhodotorula pacifica]|uniref:uncharacterized protein n=1 Tax=Rhodotorula pacifica TaxID=1495444 RepID=UPI00317138CB
MHKSILSLVALAAYATATLSVQDGKLSIIDSVSASTTSTDSFASSSSFSVGLESKHRTLSETDVLKLTFTVKRDEKPFQPQQASLVVRPIASSSSSVGEQLAIKVRPNSGKAKWDLDLSRPSSAALLQRLASLSHSASPDLALTLLVGHPNEPTPISINLGTVQLPSSLLSPGANSNKDRLPKHWHAEKYAPQPEIRWTFREGEKRVNPLVALGGLAVVLAPWLVLLATIPRLPLSLSSPTLPTSLFLLSLLSLETLSILSWIHFLPVLRMLPYFAAIGAASVLTGRRALGEMGRKRRRSGEAQGEKKTL